MTSPFSLPLYHPVCLHGIHNPFHLKPSEASPLPLSSISLSVTHIIQFLELGESMPKGGLEVYNL